PVRRRPRGRRVARARGDGLARERGPAVLPHVPRHARDGSHGHDRARVRRAHLARAAHGVRARAQPPHRAADGRVRRLMSTTAQTSPEGLVTDHSRAVADGAHSHGVVPGSSRAERATSFELADFAVPTGREEEWRFSPVDRIAPLFAEGITSTGVQTTVVAPPEVTVEIVGRSDARRGLAGEPGDRAAAAAWAGAQEATVVTVPANAVASKVTSVRVEGLSADDVSAAHLIVHAKENSEAVVLIDHA